MRALNIDEIDTMGHFSHLFTQTGWEAFLALKLCNRQTMFGKKVFGKKSVWQKVFDKKCLAKSVWQKVFGKKFLAKRASIQA